MMMKRIQQPGGYFYGYTWAEVFQDELVQVLMPLHLFVICFFFRNMELSMENLGAYVLLFIQLLQCAWFLRAFGLVGGEPWSWGGGSDLHAPATPPSASADDGAKLLQPPRVVAADDAPAAVEPETRINCLFPGRPCTPYDYEQDAYAARRYDLQKQIAGVMIAFASNYAQQG